MGERQEEPKAAADRDRQVTEAGKKREFVEARDGKLPGTEPPPEASIYEGIPSDE